MKEIVDEFMDIVLSVRFDTDRAANQKLVERCELLLIDGSRLVAYESTTGIKFKYGYQWMNNLDQTLYRWDNTTHFPDLDTYPYHRHVGAAEVAEPFPMVSLHEVLLFVAAQLSNQK